jgi:hypothetical protein
VIRRSVLRNGRAEYSLVSVFNIQHFNKRISLKTKGFAQKTHLEHLQIRLNMIIRSFQRFRTVSVIPPMG